jgi:hypothetical protein
MMIRKADDRLRDQQGDCDGWFTFHPEHRLEAMVDGFGALQMLNEYTLSANAHVPNRLIESAALVTYVEEGVLSCRDSFGRESTCRAGEFSHTAGLRNIHYSETNSSSDKTHIVQLYLRGNDSASASSREQKRFSVADRRGRWCVVAAPDGRDGSLVVGSDAVVCSAILEVGQHVVYELPETNRAWLHLLRGQAMLNNNLALKRGDGVGVVAGPVSLTATAETEGLLIVTE